MASAVSGYRAYTIVWAGQFISLVGTNLAGFALSIYVFRLTGSATTLGIMFAASLVPTVLASPYTGAIVDRWGPRRSLYVSSTGNVAVTLILAAILGAHVFAVWQGYLIVAALATLNALEIPAFAKVTPLLVRKSDLGRANGLRVFAFAASQVISPIAGGALLLTIGIANIVLINTVSFAVVIVSLLVVDIPRPTGPAEHRQSLLGEFRDGWRYVHVRPGLVALMTFVAGINFAAGFLELLIAPVILGFASAAAAGIVLTVGGLGMVVSGVANAVTGGPRRRVRAILVGSAVLGAAVVVGATRPNVALVAAAAFVGMGALGLIIGSNQVIWQSKVDRQILGRVTALVTMVGTVPQLAANLLAGVTADRVFAPLVGRDHVRSSTLALFIGTGPGRGAALLLMLVGVGMLLGVAVAATRPRLRHLEDDLPDAGEELVSAATEPLRPVFREPEPVPHLDGGLVHRD
jgi:MFS transporter, DHA3 family, macrolide efflux protein